MEVSELTSVTDNTDEDHGDPGPAREHQQEVGDDPTHRSGAGRRHHRLSPVRDWAQGGNHLHEGK